MRIAVMACDRAPNYIQPTLRSMFVSDDVVRNISVTVVVDGDSGRFLGPWLSDPRVDVALLGAEKMAARHDLSIHQKISATCLRALESACGDDLVLCQDDIIFSRDWLKRTMFAAGCAREKLLNRRRGGQLCDQDFAIALYTTRKLRLRPIEAYPAQYFFGNQALYLPASLVERLALYLRQRAQERKMDDMLFKEYFWHNGIKLWAINPNVVQHVGQRGTHAGGFHQSPSFKE